MVKNKKKYCFQQKKSGPKALKTIVKKRKQLPEEFAA